MKVLVACEFSGIVRDAFISRGHDAISCDLLDTESPGPHYKGDVLDYVQGEKFDLIIAHPPCTALTVAGNSTYGFGMKKHTQRIESARWTEQLWNACKLSSPKVCFENPVGVLSRLTSMPKAYYIHPYQFGHDASKKTGLWLVGLPTLETTQLIPPRLVCCGETLKDNDKYGCPDCCGDKTPLPRWGNQTNSGQNKLPPSKDRWKLRSKTYKGIAEAMSKQWS